MADSMSLRARGWVLRQTRLLGALVLIATTFAAAAPTYAATFTVTKTADTNDGACNADCSLREAIRAANANADADTITVPAGTFQFTLTGNEDAAALGDLDITNPVTIIGAGAGATIIDGQDTDRVFDVAPVSACACAITFSGLTITNGNANAGNFNVGGAMFIGGGVTATISNSVISSSSSVSSSGGGIQANNPSLTLNNVTFQNNDAFSSGGALRAIGNLSITDSTFTSNEAEFGGAIALAQDSAKTISITGSTFSGNHTTVTAAGNADDGGALFVDIDTTLTLTGNNFSGNTSVNNGGAIYFRDNATAGTGALVANFNRIAGNTATAAGGAIFVASGTANAENNWWGCNTGPVAPCNLVSGTADTNPWLTLTLTASPTTVGGGATSTLTASLLINSAGSTVAPGGKGAPVSWGSATLGTLSAQQTTIQTSGTATATYTAGATPGSGGASVTVDSQTVSVTITVVSVATTTTITADTPDPSVVGQSVTVSYTVTAASGTPTGNVTVSDGTSSCTGTVAAGSCALTFTTTGTKTLTATYAGGGGFTGSTSAGASHTVNQASTTTTITADTPDPSVVGQSVTIAYSVAPVAPGSGTPTGNVTVSDGTSSCTGTVAAGSCALTFTTTGTKTLTATYAGSASFAGSTSAGASHTVNQASTTTTITGDTPDPSSVGGSVTVSFSVAAVAPGSGTPTGNVTVSDGVNNCTGTVAAGSCALTLTTAGARTLTATYAGDSNFAGSTSAGAAHTVSQAGTTTTLTGDAPDPSVVGETITVSFSVTSAGGTPSGNVTVSDGVSNCTATVAAGTCDLALTTVGARTLTATYAGDSNFAGSTSVGVAHTVNKAGTTTTITGATPAVTAPNQAVTVAFSVVALAPGAGTPTGNVTVSDGVDSCTATLAAGSCALTLTTAGSRSLTATYAGDSNFNGSASSATTHVVDGTAPGVTVNQAASQVDPTGGATIHFTAVFDEPVSGFASADVTLGGTAGATTAVVTESTPNDGTTFDIAVSGMTGPGTVVVTIQAGVATDAVGNGNTASISTDNSVTYTLNQNPTAAADTYSTNEGTPLTVGAPGVLGNDSDSDGDAITAILVSGPSHAAAFTLNADGSFSYTAAAAFSGVDSFSYRAQDSNGAQSAVVVVSIGVSTPPQRHAIFLPLISTSTAGAQAAR